jgi:integrase
MAIRPLKDLYGETPASMFGPVALKAVRQKMIASGLARTTINQRIGCIKRIFKWAVSEELVPANVHYGLQAVTGLKRGRSPARETEPVVPVPDVHVAAVLPFLTPTVRCMVQLQRLTGMRSAEVCQVRGRDIETGGDDVWIYRPAAHKTLHLGHKRIIRIGPKAQELLRPFLLPDLNAYLFSPKGAREQRYAAMRATRKSTVPPSQRQRRKHAATRLPGEVYSTKSYYRAVHYGIIAARKAGALAADIHWHPHQLRHSHATEVRKVFGLDAVRAVLGQRSLEVADRYAEVDAALAGRVAAQVG